MKKVIDLLEKAEAAIMLAFSGTDEADLCTEAINHINDAIDELKTPPRWETPEQREKRTGEKWPDDWGVYFYNGYLGWETKKYGTWKNMIISLGDEGGYERAPEHEIQYPAVCATEAGPPPDGWKPEE
jgi:hypothetical protein